MKYDFDEIISRRNTCSYKWDGENGEEVLPMWVADMDFRTAPAIVQALQERVAHGIFGYTRVPEAYYEAVSDWFGRRHGWKIPCEWMIYTSGVVPALSAVIKALTVPGDKVVVQTPVYNCFFSSIRNNGCECVTSSLVRECDTYRIDFEDLERKVAGAKLMVLCNPHNPVGRVWTKEELERIGTICIRHGVTVVSDEIHGELVYLGHVYTPFASLSDEFARHSVTCFSPSKAFNIAGLQIATIVAQNEDVRRKIDRAININEVCDVNPFGVVATLAAYREGEEWLCQLTDYLWENYQCMKRFCATFLPLFPLMKLEGTYLVWMDCRKLGVSSAHLEEHLIREVGLHLNAGTMYGEEGEGFMRWNIACPRASLIEGLERFRSYADRHLEPAEACGENR